MNGTTLVKRRLGAQQLAHRRFASPVDLVRHFGAVQAQDYAGCKWAVGARLDRAVKDTDIETALGKGHLVRTHAFRYTWQLVAPDDVRFILELVAPRLQQRVKSRHAQLDLDGKTLSKCGRAIERALGDGAHLTRAELADVLVDAGVTLGPQRLSHILGHLELEGLICNGARKGKQLTWALLDDRVPRSAKRLTRDEAVVRLAERYFQSRGPATLADFVWWTGLTMTDAKQAVSALGDALVKETVDGRVHHHIDAPAPRVGHEVHLLPAFDEWLIGYRNREAVLDRKHVGRINAGGGMLDACVLVEGRVVGTWRKTPEVEVELFAGVKGDAALEKAVRRYRAFVE